MFHRRKPSNSTPSELDTISALLHQQTTENSMLKNKIEDLKEANVKNAIISARFFKENEESEIQIQELKKNYQELNEKIKEQETKLKTLREVKFQLITDKDTNNPQSSSITNMQDLLELISCRNEMLIFKDKNDRTWEIIKRNDIKLGDA